MSESPFVTLSELVEQASSSPAIVETDFDSSYASEDVSDSEYDALTAQQQWEQSAAQLKALVEHVLFPLIGKVLGRRCAHVLWRQVAEWWFV